MRLSAAVRYFDLNGILPLGYLRPWPNYAADLPASADEKRILKKTLQTEQTNSTITKVDDAR